MSKDFVTETIDQAKARLGEIDSEIKSLREQRDQANAKIRDLTKEREGVARIAAIGKPRTRKPKPAPSFTPPAE